METNTFNLRNKRKGFLSECMSSLIYILFFLLAQNCLLCEHFIVVKNTHCNPFRYYSSLSFSFQLAVGPLRICSLHALQRGAIGHTHWCVNGVCVFPADHGAVAFSPFLCVCTEPFDIVATSFLSFLRHAILSSSRKHVRRLKLHVEPIPPPLIWSSPRDSVCPPLSVHATRPSPPDATIKKEKGVLRAWFLY
ncbi:hypothetical protein ABB37_01626 [Leptomonas pyrrhocoris]|uniref:Uncharacterized protein n=1 Tax=Leptomonas pyrrhocoris TaxID=157538 RepID=A0A0N0DZH5_LEPPY|nr:hypothetical protein ABB37_01626 [Leptomonas pyrrhocoris]XP_015663724.1 hypothetical protein ABB37_01626 [Leptomonas pyrrhocoris]KPA85284.1 hypothetical protein ABB37_01626 [Leptomonas pyrrhocoris]KPA85285.1 hypothetical protein ABB37_01626 [Leptomonas pyrrhocoris]|eukprot:XP_015663723.1 hypothetical protein ABB37_01626 [Leptomonas pyrrhocoris]